MWTRGLRARRPLQQPDQDPQGGLSAAPEACADPADHVGPSSGGISGAHPWSQHRSRSRRRWRQQPAGRGGTASRTWGAGKVCRSADVTGGRGAAGREARTAAVRFAALRNNSLGSLRVANSLTNSLTNSRRPINLHKKPWSPAMAARSPTPRLASSIAHPAKPARPSATFASAPIARVRQGRARFALARRIKAPRRRPPQAKCCRLAM